MNAGELEYKFRLAIQDEVEDYLFPKEEVFDFMNEAIVEACARSELKVSSDINNPLCVIDLVPGNNSYELSQFITKVKAVRLKTATKTKILPVKDYRELDSCYGYSWQDREGEPICVVAGLESDSLTLYKTPTVADKLLLTVVHLPTTEIENDEDEIPIPSQHQRKLLHWMLYKGYSKNDSEAKSDKLAQIHLGYFEQYFGNNELSNARYQQYGKISTVYNHGMY